jgi:hypothetical protein
MSFRNIIYSLKATDHVEFSKYLRPLQVNAFYISNSKNIWIYFMATRVKETFLFLFPSLFSLHLLATFCGARSLKSAIFGYISFYRWEKWHAAIEKRGADGVGWVGRRNNYFILTLPRTKFAKMASESISKSSKMHKSSTSCFFNDWTSGSSPVASRNRQRSWMHCLRYLMCRWYQLTRRIQFLQPCHPPASLSRHNFVSNFHAGAWRLLDALHGL